MNAERAMRNAQSTMDGDLPMADFIRYVWRPLLALVLWGAAIVLLDIFGGAPCP